MKKYLLILLPILLGVVLLMAYDETKETEEATQETTKKVNAVNPKLVEHRAIIFASGRLSSKEEIKLSFKTGGIIKKIHAAEGQYLPKGKLLAELTLNEITAQNQQAQLGVQQAEITIENAKLALKIAERDYRNTKGLYQDSVATLEQLENAELQLNNATNQLKAAETGLKFSQKNVDIANFNLEHSKIYAPSNGIILRKIAEPNELIGPGTPVFLFGTKDKAQVIRVNLTDKDIIHIELGNEATIGFDAYPDQIFKGNVREIASSADPYTGTYEVEIEVRSNNRKLLSGFIGTVNILTNQSQKVLRIPIDALLKAKKTSGEIFTITDGKAVKTNIEILKIQENDLLIKNNLSEDLMVVTTGAGYLKEGEAVEIAKHK